MDVWWRGQPADPPKKRHRHVPDAFGSDGHGRGEAAAIGAWRCPFSAVSRPRIDVLHEAQSSLWPALLKAPASFTLQGGTAIALRLGRRESVDFEFVARLSLSPQELPSSVPCPRDEEPSRPHGTSARGWRQEPGSAAAVPAGALAQGGRQRGAGPAHGRRVRPQARRGARHRGPSHVRRSAAAGARRSHRDARHRGRLARKDAPVAIAATARELACLIHTLVTRGEECVERRSRPASGAAWTAPSRTLDGAPSSSATSWSECSKTRNRNAARNQWPREVLLKREEAAQLTGHAPRLVSPGACSSYRFVEPDSSMQTFVEDQPESLMCRSRVGRRAGSGRNAIAKTVALVTKEGATLHDLGPWLVCVMGLCPFRQRAELEGVSGPFPYVATHVVETVAVRREGLRWSCSCVSAELEGVSGPFPYVATHVVETVAVRREGLRWSCSCVSVGTGVLVRESALPYAAGEEGGIVGFLLAPWKWHVAKSASCRVLPFDFGWVASARPARVGPSVVSGHMDRRVIGVPGILGIRAVDQSP